MPTVNWLPGNQSTTYWTTNTSSFAGWEIPVNFTSTGGSITYTPTWAWDGSRAEPYIYQMPQPAPRMDLGELSRRYADQSRVDWEYHDRVFREQEQERLQVRQRARDRATETLLGLLNPDERAAYERDGHLVVAGSAGGRYRIEPGYQQNVYELDEHGNRRAGGRLCAHPVMHDEVGALPREDAMVAQLLMLRYNEPGFLAIANRS